MIKMKGEKSKENLELNKDLWQKELSSKWNNIKLVIL